LVSKSSTINESNRRRIATEEEALEIRRRLSTINDAAIPDIADTASNVLIDPVMGPWPQCVGMQADDCVELIESLAADVYTVVVLPVETERTRVKIMTDYDQKVIRVPHRG